MASVPEFLEPSANDIKMLVLADTHISTRKVEPGMKTYVYGKADQSNTEFIGCSLIDLQKTWDKLVLAARVLAAVEDPASIYCVGQRLFAQRAIIKFAKQIGATGKPGRFTPGQFTNQVTKCFVEPRILLVADPRTDSQAVKEASYVNIPTIAFCGSDSNLQYIDIAIPGNNRVKESLGLLYWLLAREVKRIRDTEPRDSQDLMVVDLFFYKDPEELEKMQEEMAEEQEEYEDYGYDNADYGTEAVDDDANWAGPTPMGGHQNGNWSEYQNEPVNDQNEWAQQTGQEDEWQSAQQTGFEDTENKLDE